jgi:hypothetical protein
MQNPLLTIAVAHERHADLIRAATREHLAKLASESRTRQVRFARMRALVLALALRGRAA